MEGDWQGWGSAFPMLRFTAMLKAAREFGLDQESVNAIALCFDPGRPDFEWIADLLSDALLRGRALSLPDAV